MIKTIYKNIALFQFKYLTKFNDIQHFTTCKNHIGENQLSVSLSSIKNPVPIIKNRQLLAEALNLKPENFVFQQQEHTKNIAVVNKEHAGKGFFEHTEGFADNDAMITTEKDLCLMIMGADCVPVLLFDPVKKAIGAAHAGWRGTVQNISAATIEAMQNKFGCQPQNILAGIGPSIGPQNYEVDDVVYNAFNKNFNYSPNLFTKGKQPGKYQLDLWEANKIQLIKAGLKEENIEVSGICTFENNKDFFSARKGDKGRFASGIMIY